MADAEVEPGDASRDDDHLKPALCYLGGQQVEVAGIGHLVHLLHDRMEAQLAEALEPLARVVVPACSAKPWDTLH